MSNKPRIVYLTAEVLPTPSKRDRDPWAAPTGWTFVRFMRPSGKPGQMVPATDHRGFEMSQMVPDAALRTGTELKAAMGGQS
jgi:hypothetical protein